MGGTHRPKQTDEERWRTIRGSLTHLGRRAGPEAAAPRAPLRRSAGLSPSSISLVAGPILTKREGRKGWVRRLREEARYVTRWHPLRPFCNPTLGSGILSRSQVSMAYQFSRKGCFKCGNRASSSLHVHPSPSMTGLSPQWGTLQRIALRSSVSATIAASRGMSLLPVPLPAPLPPSSATPAGVSDTSRQSAPASGSKVQAEAKNAT